MQVSPIFFIDRERLRRSTSKAIGDGWREPPKLQILTERRRERRFPTVVEYRF
jgi:hypothetical protein